MNRNMLRQLLLLTSLIFGSCVKDCRDSAGHHIGLSPEIEILVSNTNGNFSEEDAYTEVEFCIDRKLIKVDPKVHHFIFKRNGMFPMGRRLKNGSFEIVLVASGLPLNNYLVAYTIEGFKLSKERKLPLLYPHGEKAKIYYGQLFAQEDTGKPDSCFYNPTLYYVDTENGFEIDSTMTESEMTKEWGRFLGFDSTNDILPCPQRP